MQWREERNATAKALRALTSDLITNRLDITSGASGEPDKINATMTDASLVNEMLRTARLPLEEKRYEALKSRQERPGAGAYYLILGSEMLREPNKVVTDQGEVRVVPTLIVRVRGNDQHMGTNLLTPAYLSKERDEDLDLTLGEKRTVDDEIDRAYRADRAALYALASLRHQIEDLGTNGQETDLHATLKKLGIEQVRLEFEEWRDRSGEVYKMITPISSVKL
jgi:hypothetical protein